MTCGLPSDGSRCNVVSESLTFGVRAADENRMSRKCGETRAPGTSAFCGEMESKLQYCVSAISLTNRLVSG